VIPSFDPNVIVVRVRAPTRFGWTADRGELSIAPGRIVVTPSRFGFTQLALTELVHTNLDISACVARLLPPWCNTALLLGGNGQRVVVSTGRATCRRLRAAGFALHEHSQWFLPSPQVMEALAARDRRGAAGT